MCLVMEAFLIIQVENGEKKVWSDVIILHDFLFSSGNNLLKIIIKESG